MALGLALAAALAASLLAVSGAGGAPAQAPKRGGTVVVAWAYSEEEPGCVLPSDQCQRGLVQTELSLLVLADMLEVGPQGWRLNLVSSATLTKKPFTVTYRLRPDARWSDGTPITAADWVFSYRYATRYLPPPWRIDPQELGIRRVEALDAQTVRVAFDSPRADWESQIGFSPLPRHVLRAGIRQRSGGARWTIPGRAHRSRAARSSSSAGAAPGSSCAATRATGGPHASYLDRVVFRLGVSDPAQALRDGVVDVVGGATAVSQAAALSFRIRPAPGITARSVPSNGSEQFGIRVGPGGHPALKLKAVRRALAYGIDRVALVRALYSRTAPNVPVLDSAALLPNERGYEPNWSRYRYRPALARSLLEQAGCRRGTDRIYVRAGQRMSLRFATTAGVDYRERTIQIVQAQLGEAGIEVVPVFAPANAFFGQILPSGAFDVALYRIGKAPEVNGAELYTCGHVFNNTGYCSRLFTADYGEGNRIVDRARFVAVANRADRRLAGDVPMIPLFQTPKFVAYRSSIRGLAPNAFASEIWNAEDWWLER